MLHNISECSSGALRSIFIIYDFYGLEGLHPHSWFIHLLIKSSGRAKKAVLHVSQSSPRLFGFVFRTPSSFLLSQTCSVMFPRRSLSGNWRRTRSPLLMQRIAQRVRLMQCQHSQSPGCQKIARQNFEIPNTCSWGGHKLKHIGELVHFCEDSHNIFPMWLLEQEPREWWHFWFDCLAQATNEYLVSINI